MPLSRPSLITMLASQPFMKVVRTLLIRPRVSFHLREIAKFNQLSASGTAAILAKLETAGLLCKKQVKNKVCYTLKLTDKEEERTLQDFFKQYETTLIKDRNLKLNSKKNLAKYMEWQAWNYAAMLQVTAVKEHNKL